MMIVTAARALEGVRTVFVGVGLPNSACNLARRTVAPELELIYESGIYGARPARLPLSIGDPTLISGSTAVCSMADLFGLYLQGGRVEVAFLGGAQIDRFGNLNTTVIGGWEDPKVRLPGSGGACEIAINAQRVFVIMRLKRRAFVDQLHFRTSPGHLGGTGEREQLGIPGAGPQLVVTDKCVLGFDEATREMTLEKLYPGVTLGEVQENVGWDLRVVPGLQQVTLPSQEELRLLREELDPEALYR
ncbi:MAG: CoA-transferase [Anaerolineae bacterium]|jgi:glutaconate CoA-transferase subunit B